MGIDVIVFVVLVVTTIYNLGVQAYIHFEAYPLFGSVGKPEFTAYIKAYEDRLTIPLLLPYGLTMLSNLVLLVLRPAKIDIILAIAALILNGAVAAVTMRVATPVYNQMKVNGSASGETMSRLMQINLLRLILSLLAVVVVVIMLFAALGA